MNPKVKDPFDFRNSEYRLSDVGHSDLQLPFSDFILDVSLFFEDGVALGSLAGSLLNSEIPI